MGPLARHALLDNAVWHALGTGDRAFAEERAGARRYRPGVSVFAGVERLDAAGWAALGALAGPDAEVVVFRAEIGATPGGWTEIFAGHGHQMVGEALSAPPASVPIRPLGADDTSDMVHLVGLARPGPFLAGTVALGGYVGVCEDGRLLAMAGERMHLPGLVEISAVCTHPEARGRGLGAAVTAQVAAAIAARGATPFLHVAEDNHGARRIYERLGFVTRRMVDVRVVRTPPGPPPTAGN